MKRAAYSISLPLIAILGFLAGSRFNQPTVAAHSAAGGRKTLYYVDPMHPAYKSDKPGIAPDCGMQLEAVYADSASPAAASEPQPAGAIRIDAEKQRRIGVQVSAAERTTATHSLRLFGRVAPDETRVYRLIAGLDGFIRRISPVTTGSQVAKDQWLASYSAPELRVPMQGFLVTLDVVERQKQGGVRADAQVKASNESVQQARDRVLNLGLSDLQMEELQRTREIPTDIRVHAPAAGFVLSRNVTVGQRFEKGAEWYRIADLRRVWILADVFEADSKSIRPGQNATVRLPSGETMSSARVSEVLPQFDAASRTLKVRLEMDNPGYRLRPDMFVDVELSVAVPPGITVPSDAVLDSGLRKVVFVDRGEGLFEPRTVETGWRFGGRVQILGGLKAGERVVTTGNFLLDSESRIEQAAAGSQAAAPAKDPVCGMELQPGQSGYTSEYGGKRYRFCSSQCQRRFQKERATGS